MNIKLRYLGCFVAVAEHLNFSRAAEQMQMGQPALSRQILELERELGARLFERTRARVELSDAGRTLYPHACRILADVDTAVTSVLDTRTGNSGELLLCSDRRFSSDFADHPIWEFQSRFPRVRVTLKRLHLHEELAAVRGGEVHVAFVVETALVNDGELSSAPVVSSPVLVASCSDHPLAATKQVRIADLADQNWVVAQDPPGWGEFIQQVCRLSGFLPKVRPVARTVRLLLRHLASTRDLTLVPAFAASPALLQPGIALVPTDSTPVCIRAAWRTGERSLLARRFVSLLVRGALPARSVPARATAPSPAR